MSDPNLTGRLERERSFHDSMIVRKDTRGGYFYRWGLSRRAINHGKAQLGKINGTVVLDYGCGDLQYTLDFAQSGAHLVDFDISMKMAQVARIKGIQADLIDKVAVCQMAGEATGFRSETFDLIFGISVLHHLDISIAGPELARILRPGGKAVFVEPLAHNPWLNLFRRLTPHRRSADEAPLTLGQLRTIGSYFSELRHAEFALFSTLAVLFPIKPLFAVAMSLLESLDTQLLKTSPALRKCCWMTVIELVK
jgi:SAM-dependent methyltransferase